MAKNKMPKNALVDVPRNERLVRIVAGRGAQGLYEVIAASPAEYTLRPYGWSGDTVQIYRTLTVRARSEEIQDYLGRKKQ